MLRNIKPYKKESEYSYTLGVFLTIELLKYKPQNVQGVVLSSQSNRNSGAAKIEELAAKRQIPVEIHDKTISRLSPKENCYAVGIFKKYEAPIMKNENHVVLVNPMDSGNLGTIMRTCLGFGIKNLAVIYPAVDVFDPKTVRASMGAIFSLNFMGFESFDDYIEFSKDRNLFPFLLNGRKTLHEITTYRQEPYSLIFGNESSGLPKEFEHIGTSLVIPHSSEIDSLNLSIAVSLAAYEFTKPEFGK